MGLSSFQTWNIFCKSFSRYFLYFMIPNDLSIFNRIHVVRLTLTQSFILAFYTLEKDVDFVQIFTAHHWILEVLPEEWIFFFCKLLFSIYPRSPEQSTFLYHSWKSVIFDSELQVVKKFGLVISMLAFLLFKKDKNKIMLPLLSLQVIFKMSN